MLELSLVCFFWNIYQIIRLQKKKKKWMLTFKIKNKSAKKNPVIILYI
jgi:hypothetical protein